MASLSDKIKLIKALSNNETKEKIQSMLMLKIKMQKAAEATAQCIAEGLGEPQEITALSISAGKNGFLPLEVTVTADGVEAFVESVQPEDVDFRYDVICEDFNKEIDGNDDEKTEFLKKTAQLLDSIIADNGVAADNFSTKIC